MSHFFYYRNYLLIFVALSISMSIDETTNTINFNETMTRTDYGVVKYYNEEKGFGYIIDHETKDELFVYDEGLIDEIYAEDEVQFVTRDSKKGLEALDVRLNNSYY